MQSGLNTHKPVSPFHPGEQAVQSRLGVRQAIEPWARKVVRPFMPQQHREFYARLPFVVASARDGDERQWVTLLAGPTGFIQSPDARGLQISALPHPGDALANALQPGADLGLLGIELETRQRNRVNGHVETLQEDGFRFDVDQAFGNCPQYITERTWRRVEIAPEEATASRHQCLDAGMRVWISTADTFFIGSGYRGDGTANEAFGVDASHRGGAPGFIKVLNDTRLVFPDYAGNNHFNTIGNLVLDPHVGLLFVDFETGSLMQITGCATIDFDSDEVARHPGAQRLVIVEIEEIVLLEGVLPLRWSDPGDAVRVLRVVQKIRESDDVTSFVLAARDGGELVDFEAGQHLPIEVQVDGYDHPLKRTYSLSIGPDAGLYRITVKREPLGAVSRHLHDKVHEGDFINARAPAGEFILENSDRPVVLISAGVGITPMVSMLHAEAGSPQHRPVTTIHGARDGAHHPLAGEVQSLAQQSDNVRLEVAYSRPRAEDTAGHAYHHTGRVDAELINAAVPDFDADFYMCGPTPFMADVITVLSARGVPDECIHTETFGPAA
jgi:ferredoxin-NADP reductase/predicted pyridoxine 5'-phosphate oxidase superfamily flavin-nucleotide-binding protein